MKNEMLSTYRRASNISHRFKKTADAVMFATKSVDALNNTDASRSNHKKHLVKMLRVAGEPDKDS